MTVISKQQDLFDFDRAVTEADRVVRACVPELSGQAFYVVDSDSVPALAVAGARAWYAQDLDAMLRPVLEQRDAWRGPGIAIVVSSGAVAADSRDADDAMRRTIGWLLHELCHWLVEPSPTAAHRPETSLQSFLKRATASESAIETEPSKRDLRSYLLHGPQFTRAACHLWYRANHGGGRIMGMHHLCFANQYPGLEFLHAPHQYVDALGAELLANMNAPMSVVRNHPPAAEFVEMCRDDLERLRSLHPAVA